MSGHGSWFSERRPGGRDRGNNPGQLISLSVTNIGARLLLGLHPRRATLQDGLWELAEAIARGSAASWGCRGEGGRTCSRNDVFPDRGMVVRGRCRAGSCRGWASPSPPPPWGPAAPRLRRASADLCLRGLVGQQIRVLPGTEPSASPAHGPASQRTSDAPPNTAEKNLPAEIATCCGEGSTYTPRWCPSEMIDVLARLDAEITASGLGEALRLHANHLSADDIEQLASLHSSSPFAAAPTR